MKKLKKWVKKGSFYLGLYSTVALSSFASTNKQMIWEDKTRALSDSISGPMAMFLGIIAIVVAALGWALTDGGSMMGKAIKIVLALIIAAGAATLVAGFFGFTGGATFA